MIYRGQAYGHSVGEWWTSAFDEARQFAMSRGGNRSYVVLSLDEDDETWLARFRLYERAGSSTGDWFRIPIAELKARWRGVTVLSGSVDLEWP